jgi:hypothetical protein
LLEFQGQALLSAVLLRRSFYIVACLGKTLFLYFFFLGSVTGVSSDTVVCKAYVPPFPVLSVMGKVLGSRVLFALLFFRLAAATDLVVLLLGEFSDFHALRRCAFDHEVSVTASATSE